MDSQLKAYTGIEYLKQLALHEDKLAELYTALAVAIPGAAEFWNSLAAEEKTHENLLIRLREEAVKTDAQLARPAFRLQQISESMEFIAYLTDRARKKDIRMREALEKAIILETALLESKWFEIVQDDDEGTRKALNFLQQSTETHQQQLIREQGRLKWKIFG